MKFSVVPLLVILSITSAEAQGGPLPQGVYDCFGPGMAEGGTVGHGAGQLNVSGAKFSVIGPDQYLSRGGKTGRFVFDGVTLLLADGPYEGLRFHKVTPQWTFRMLRENGQEGPFICPRNPTKDPRDPNKW